MPVDYNYKSKNNHSFIHLFLFHQSNLGTVQEQILIVLSSLSLSLSPSLFLLSLSLIFNYNPLILKRRNDLPIFLFVKSLVLIFFFLS